MDIKRRHNIELFIDRLPTHQEKTNTIDRSLGWLVGWLGRWPQLVERKRKKDAPRLLASGLGRVFLPLHPRFKPQCARLSSPRCLTCLLGLQGV